MEPYDMRARDISYHGIDLVLVYFQHLKCYNGITCLIRKKKTVDCPDIIHQLIIPLQ